MQLLNKVCKKLFDQSDVQYFCLARYYKDNSCSFLASNMEFAKTIFHDKNLLRKTWISSLLKNAPLSGVHFWNQSKYFSATETVAITDLFEHEFHVGEGIDIIETADKFTDIFSFAADSHAIYKTTIPSLIHYIYYFRQECRTLITDMLNDNKSANIFDKSQDQHFITPVHSLGSPITDNISFPIKRYYFGKAFPDTYITPKELDCIRKLGAGFHIKQVADQLHCSTRTIENHVRNVKLKLGCSLLTQVLQILRNSHLL